MKKSYPLIYKGAMTERAEEEYIPEHVLCHILEGELRMQYVNNEISHQQGSTLLIKKNHLVKCEKCPSANGRYQVIFLMLDEGFLRDYQLEVQRGEITTDSIDQSMLIVHPKPALEGVVQSLISYARHDYIPSSVMIRQKQQEAVLALLEQDPRLYDWLFADEKISRLNLADYMEKNFRFNIPVSKFAELTGRSLSTFQRDFIQTFGMKASSWLRKRRLKAAYELLLENKQPSDIYLFVGFEDLSHFSRCFKQEFNIPPSMVHRKIL